MSASVHGPANQATKIVGVHEGNPARSPETVNALVVAIDAYTPEMRELDRTTIEQAARVFAKIAGEVAGIGDVTATDLGAAELGPFATLFEDAAGRRAPEEILAFERLGSAVLDAAAGEHLLHAAGAASVGARVFLE